ncbi:MAG: hypothetical protein DRK00_04715 [Thermoprotei archaeon]|nr:MAG: hypothetical protein DRK00_04715 [Thermoprotei archaeon]
MATSYEVLGGVLSALKFYGEAYGRAAEAARVIAEHVSGPPQVLAFHAAEELALFSKVFNLLYEKGVEAMGAPPYDARQYLGHVVVSYLAKIGEVLATIRAKEAVSYEDIDHVTSQIILAHRVIASSLVLTLSVLEEYEDEWSLWARLTLESLAEEIKLHEAALKKARELVRAMRTTENP